MCFVKFTEKRECETEWWCIDYALLNPAGDFLAKSDEEKNLFWIDFSEKFSTPAVVVDKPAVVADKLTVVADKLTVVTDKPATK